jgi:signal transduction histidine kinase
LRHAQQLSSAVKEFRTLYTSEVVERLTERDIVVSHDYKQHGGSIPLPATLSIMLGERIAADNSGTDVRLYSPYPFPSREGGLPDEFGQRAWSELSEDPDAPVYDFSETPAGLVLRYATADRMRPSCVRCHNSHPDTPKSDWQVGDLRGVLDVTLALGPEIAEANSSLKSTASLLLFVGLLGLGGLWVVMDAFRRSSVEANLHAEEMDQANEALETEIIEHKLSSRENDTLRGQLIHAQKVESLGLLAGGIAHDFNNLLTPIIGNANLLHDGLPDDSPTRVAVEDIESAAASAAELCQEMLAFSGKGSFGDTLIDINELIANEGSLLEFPLADNCVIEYDLAPELPPLRGVVSQIRQAILNLVSNSSEAIGDEKGVIRVRTFSRETFPSEGRTPVFDCLERGPYVVIEVTDNGKGMSKRTREMAFDPFFTTKATGRGLGLSAVLGIVKAHQGAILLTSFPEVATQIQLAFSAAPLAHPNQEPTETPTRVGGHHSGTILVVDDEPGVLRLAQKVMLRVGFDVLTAAEGKKAVRLFEQNAPDIACVILDLTMPDMGGGEVFKEIRRIRTDIPILFCSGFDDAQFLRDLEDPGPSASIPKPYRPADLVSAVEALMAANTRA